MYNVLLVDDEALSLEGLIKLVPWHELGFQIIGAVHSGFEALKIIDEQQIHLLVTDIKMPIMSGLTLLEAAKKKVPHLKSVFISGYEDFQYAQNAIRMKASGYVLKPVDDDELIEVIKNVAKQLEAESVSNQMEKMYNQSTTYLKNQVIYELLEGSFNENTIGQLLEQCHIKIHRENLVAVVEIDNLHLKQSKHSPKENKVFLTHVLGQLTNEICQQDLGYYYKTIHHKLAIILDGTVKDIEQRLIQMINVLEQHAKCTFTIGIGMPTYDLHSIEQSYKQAEKALQYKMFFQKKKIIRFEDITEKTANEFGNFNSLLTDLFNAVVSYDLKQIDESMVKLFDYISGLQDKIVVYNCLVNILFEFETKLNAMHESLEQIMGDKLQYLNELFQYETMDGLQLWLNEKMHMVAEKLNNKKQRPNYKLINEIMDYLEDNIAERLTLQEVAEHFAFSPNYLGHIFKEETGENFSVFIINKRIEKACDLLQNTKMKVYEVADAVGYKNLSHFSRQFKENTGVSSKNYRHECGMREE